MKKINIREIVENLVDTFKNAGDIVTKVLFNRVKANNII